MRIMPGQFLLLPAGNCLTSEKLASPADTYRSIMLFSSDEALTAFFLLHPLLQAGVRAHAQKISNATRFLASSRTT
jgi:hypothetical protein